MDSRSLVLDMQSLRCLSDIQGEPINRKLDLLSLRIQSRMDLGADSTSMIVEELH